MAWLAGSWDYTAVQGGCRYGAGCHACAAGQPLGLCPQGHPLLGRLHAGPRALRPLVLTQQPAQKPPAPRKPHLEGRLQRCGIVVPPPKDQQRLLLLQGPCQPQHLRVQLQRLPGGSEGGAGASAQRNASGLLPAGGAGSHAGQMMGPAAGGAGGEGRAGGGKGGGRPTSRIFSGSSARPSMMACRLSRLEIESSLQRGWCGGWASGRVGKVLGSPSEGLAGFGFKGPTAAASLAGPVSWARQKAEPRCRHGYLAAAMATSPTDPNPPPTTDPKTPTPHPSTHRPIHLPNQPSTCHIVTHLPTPT